MTLPDLQRLGQEFDAKPAKRRGNFAPKKLTDDQVRAIRAEAATPCACCGRSETLRAIAARYGVSHVMVRKIITGQARVAAGLSPVVEG